MSTMMSSILKHTTLVATALLLCLWSSSVAEAGNLYSSNVIALTPDNWKTESLGVPSRRLCQCLSTRMRVLPAKLTPVVDYQFERQAKDRKPWIDEQMPNYSERITYGVDDLQKASAKATKYGLP
jgi:hypothetical protein